MTGKTHAICDTITTLAVTATHFSGLQLDDHTYLPATGLLTIVTGSYMPDIDIYRSKPGQQHKFTSKHLTHRGITHTLLILIILFVVMLMVATAKIPVLPGLILGFNVGWTVRTMVDLCSHEGVFLFWPFYRKRVHVATFLTSSWQEHVFVFLQLGVNVACVFFLLG